MMLYVVCSAFLAFGCVSSSAVKKDYDVFHDECGTEIAERTKCGRKGHTLGQIECLMRSCCFDDTDYGDAGVPHCFYPKRMLTAECSVDYEDKDDCGYYGITEAECMMRGCCFKHTDMPNDAICYKKAKSPVRLMNNGVEGGREGRVEIFHEGEWGTVCDDAFEDLDARVVCRQLGFDDGKAKCCAEFGQGSGSIWMDQVGCTGDESSLEDCSHNGWGSHDCSHGEDAGVICYNDGDPIPTDPPYPYYYYNYGGSGSYSYRMNGKGKGKRNHRASKRKNAKKALPLFKEIRNIFKNKAKH